MEPRASTTAILTESKGSLDNFFNELIDIDSKGEFSTKKSPRLIAVSLRTTAIGDYVLSLIIFINSYCCFCGIQLINLQIILDADMQDFELPTDYSFFIKPVICSPLTSFSVIIVSSAMNPLLNYLIDYREIFVSQKNLKII